MNELRAHYEANGQGHVFADFETLPEAAQRTLLEHAAAIDLAEIAALHRELVVGDGARADATAAGLEPADFIPLPRSGGTGYPGLWQEATRCGEEALRAGRVAAFTVAGGQGTRLGFDGPKGSYGVTPVLGKSLFQVFAEKILAASRLYGRPISWYLLTSVLNHDETVAFFERHGYFGLDPERVHFFNQGFMPAVDAEGRILMSDIGKIALSPDGHGGSLRALVRSGSVRRMEAEGIDTISYFQVDNPLVRCLDPAFIGFHLMNDSELSSKMVPKAYPEEKVGVFCQRDGKPLVVEYSDLPDALMRETDAQGQLRFRAGSIAIHVFARGFVDRLGGGGDAAARLPFHLAHKKVPFLDEAGVLRNPDSPNGYKFEMFVFDALPFAKNPVIVETERRDDFSPVKNAEGLDSPRTCRDDQLRQFARWTQAAGVPLDTDETGLPPFAFEVSPLFADTEERFITAWERLAHRPIPTGGLVLV